MESASGILLAAAALVALIWSNSGSAASVYMSLVHWNIGPWSLQHWVNDGLMVLFFFVIGLELKKEILIGELSSIKNAILPVAAALGGMIFPALVYVAFNPSGPASNGWGIPMATDIAFALAVLVLLGRRIPPALKVFLLALAIVDDLGAILVIAFFYTAQIHFEGLLLAGAGLAGILILQKWGVRSYAAYTAMGLLTWLGFVISGVHATIAGVAVGLMTPLQFKVSPDYNVLYSPVERLVHVLHPWINFLILPLFALVNAGVVLRGIELSEILDHSVHQGVFWGLLLGKTAGIFLITMGFVQLKWGSLPTGVRPIHILGVGLLGGIGFTMSLFISNLSLPPDFEVYSKTGILIGSGVAALIGYSVMWVYSTLFTEFANRH